MLQLTNKEKIIYDEKVKVLNEMLDVFGMYTEFPSTSIYKKFSIKEFISDDFQNNVYPNLKKYTGKYILSFFLYKKNNGYFNKIDSSDRLELLETVLQCINKEYSLYDYGLYDILSLVTCISNQEISPEICIKLLFKYKFFSEKTLNSSRASCLEEYINSVLSTENIEKPLEFIAFLKSEIPDFKNFSLIIMNEKISKEDRIAILKKVYKQKDQPHFISFFERNMKDLSVLDIFIEATILQNNRVREKDAAIIKLWKTIFVNAESSYNKNRIFNRLDKNEIANVNEFTKKYRSYIIDPRFCKKMFNECVSGMSTSTYYREENWKEFITFMTDGMSVDEKINLVKNIPELKALGQRFPNYAAAAYNVDDDEEFEKYISIFLEWNIHVKADYLYTFVLDKNIDFEDLIVRLDKNIFKNFASNYTFTFPLANNSSTYGLPGRMANKNYIRKMILNNECFPVAKCFDDTVIKNLGMSIESFEKSKYKGFSEKIYLGSIFTSAITVYKAIKEEAKSRSSNNMNDTDFAFAEAMINRFFKLFENQSTSEELTSYIIYASNDYRLKEVEIPYHDTTDINRIYFYSTRTTNKPIGEIYIELLTEAMNAAEECYKILCKKDSSFATNKVNFMSNMNETKNNIELICCFKDF